MITPGPPPLRRIALIATPGAQLAALLGLTDLFRIASTLHGPPPALEVVATAGDAPPGGDFAAILLPPSLQGAPTEALPPATTQWLLEHHASGTPLSSVCVGAFHLAELGVLDGRPATTHWALADVFRERFPHVLLDVDRLLVDDGDIVTAGGMMAWVDLGLLWVRRLLGPTTMLATARHLIVDPGGREQRFYRTFVPTTTHGDPAILKVQRWLQKTHTTSVSVPDMAKVAGMGERTFLRRFQAATGMRSSTYVQHLRVERARELLERSPLNVGEIAEAVGYGDAGALRKVFERWVGLSPGAYRRRFGPFSGP